jgi:acyl-CoA reductase-like NAD-dependent aldehyde dehydrogenase
MGEVMISCEKLRWLIAHGERCLAREGRPVAAMLAFTKKAYVDYKPLGVIGVIVPWNYPFHNVLSAVAAALMAGNGVMVKVSEYASFGAGRIETILRDVLARRGHDPELVQVVTGYGETGNALVTSGVDKVLFIGSPAVGKLVMKAASATLTPVILELGGKDAFIVFDDVDFEHAVDIAIRGAFINCGQNCISAERFYVQSGVYDRFVAEIKKRLSTLEQGASSIDGQRCDFGAITMEPQIKVFSELITDAVNKGAKLEMGGARFTDEKRAGKGCFWQPTLLTGVTHAMRIANEEAFGPVMSVIKFTTEAEVVKMANCTEFGLGSSVFTTDYAKAERITSQLYTGMTTVNDFGMVPMVQSLPFGGVRSSGFGAFNGAEGLRGFSRTHAVVTDRFPVRSQTPKFLQYPVNKNAVHVTQAAVSMIYGKSWIDSAKALVDLAKAAMKL